MFSSLRTRLTLIFIGLTMIPLIIVGALIALRGFNTLQEQAVHNQEELAQRAVLSLEAFFNERENELFVLTDVYGLDTLDKQAQQSILLTLLSNQPAYYQFAMVGADGEETIRITRGEVITDSDLTNRSDDPVFRAALETRTIAYSPIYFNESARDRLITVAIPIENLFTGQIGNVLIAEVRFQNIGDTVLRNIELDQGEEVFIVDRNGVIVAHRNPSLVIRAAQFTPPATNGRTTGLDGGDVILATDVLPLSNQELIVVAATSYANATALANDLSNLALIVTVATLLIAGAVVIWTVSRVVNPITNMARVAEAVQKGDLSARANEKGSGEIATLGSAFNQMTAQLQRTLEGLQQNVAQLEASNQERERLIKDLQAAKRIAEENSRLKSEFLSTMSHELRTPLNAIEGFTSIMLGGMGIELSPRAEDMVSRVSANSKRLLHLVNDFLDLSRIEAGRLELVKSPLNTQQLIQKWQDEVGILAQEKGIRFNVELSPDVPSVVLGDEDALSKVVINLLSNAFKFTHKGEVTLGVSRTSNQWMIAVTDTGIGIPPHAREYIFEEFRQVDGSSKRLYGGTGLGLSLVQKLTRVMGGNVTVQSEVGKGSTFTVTLPLEIPEHEAKEGAVA